MVIVSCWALTTTTASKLLHVTLLYAPPAVWVASVLEFVTKDGWLTNTKRQAGMWVLVFLSDCILAYRDIMRRPQLRWLSLAEFWIRASNSARIARRDCSAYPSAGRVQKNFCRLGTGRWRLKTKLKGVCFTERKICVLHAATKGCTKVSKSFQWLAV